MTVTPKDAATVIILRTGSAGSEFEVLMALRNARSAFVPGSCVFPGGRVDQGDSGEGVLRFIDDEGWAAVESSLDGSNDRVLSAGLRIAAIRETFELVTCDSSETARRYCGYGEALRSERMTFGDMLEREDLVPALDRLHFFAHWITPELMPMRYDTRFFVALAPSGQEALHDGREMTSHRWVTPREALEDYHRNKFHMVAPTIVILEELCRCGTAEEVIAATVKKKIESVLIRLVIDDGEVQEHAPDGRIFMNLVPPRRGVV